MITKKYKKKPMIKLIDTSQVFADRSKNEWYTDTGDIKTAKYKAVKYLFDSDTNTWTKGYYFVYERCLSGLFGNHIFKEKGKGVKYKTIKQCELAINKHLKLKKI